MLKLHRLELSGFKSFVDPASLEFAGGLTAIVGPNGCGKSNLADAVLWVLGERSAKTLRGETMEDVIFKGSEARKPLGMAEVTLTLLTDPSFDRAEDGVLTLSRRVFHSGESIYKINGRTVRLKEIQDLLMDTGLGIRAYSVIEQGKVGQILSGKPTERRRLLEEAAGITRYKQRKRVAEIKLEEASANLARLDDILSEVERSLRSLKRQASAARRFQERRTLYRELLEKVSLGRWAGLSARLGELEAHLAAATGREAEAAAALHRDDAALAHEREVLERLATALAERHRRSAELAATIEGKQEFVKGSRHRLQEIADRVTAGTALAAERRGEQARIAASLTELEPRRSELEHEHQAAAAEVSEDETRIAAAESAVRAAEQELERLRGTLLASLGELGTLRNRAHREQVERDKGGYRLKHLADAVREKAVAVEHAAGETTLAASKAGQLEEAIAAVAADFETARQRQEALAARHAALAEEARRGEQELAANRQRRQLLEELGQAETERREALRRALARAGLDDPTLLAERLQAPPGWERTVDLFLGELADAVVLPAGTDALGLAVSLAAGRGTGHLLESAALENGTSLPEIRDDAIRASLAGALGLSAELAAALPQAYLVDEPADARRLARRHPGIAFLARGRVWAQSGLLHVQGREARPGSLARQRERAEIDGRLPKLERQVGERKDELTATEEQQRVVGTELEEIGGRLATLREELAVAVARRDDLAAAERRLGIELQTLRGESEELERQIACVRRDAEQLAGDLAQAERRHTALEGEFDRLQRALQELREERERARTSGVSRRGRLDLLRHRLESLDSELSRLRAALASGESHLAAWQREAATLAARREEIETAIAAAQGELQQALEQRQSQEDGARGEGERVESQRSAVRTLEAAVTAERERLETCRAEIGELRVRAAGERQEAGHLRAAFREEFGRELPDAVGPAPADLEELEADLARFKEALEQAGPINELAAQEYTEQEERCRFLSEQRDDVAASVESLRRTIREINQTSSERFRTTFAEVNESFGKMFRDLFRGGEAEMRLLDEDDVLDSGIEIVARPPGKRLQNIMLLSGGEKALTAIALLFALFHTKPSPFCILDEVDAPLDDINTLRFVEMLRQHSQETQFLVITHNKLTMEAASLLYGVTMEERGVSKTVAVELDEMQPEARAASA